MASSSARRNAEMNSGIRIGTSALMRWVNVPLSSIAPRAFWAFIIFSVSSIRVGMNRSAIVIIMASSCTGKCSFASGRSRLSMASVSTMGLVV